MRHFDTHRVLYQSEDGELSEYRLKVVSCEVSSKNHEEKEQEEGRGKRERVNTRAIFTVCSHMFTIF